MKRVFKTISALLLAICIGFLFTQCNKDDDTGTTYYKLTGKVTLADNTVADGALISISSTPNAQNVVSRTVADAAGTYSFMGLEKGTYYLNATYEPSNNNNLKTTGTVILTGKEVEVVVDADKTSDLVMEAVVSDGTGTVSYNVTNGDNNSWVWDNTHSSIAFEFPYDAANAVFKGQFARAGFDVLEFDEANPTATKIKAWVDITSVETGSPSGFCGHGRDGITGCIQGTYGLELDPADTVDVYCEDGSLNTSFPNITLGDYDLWGDGSATYYQKQNSIIGSTGVATFVATEVTPYGTGYKAKGDFTFAGNTHSVDMYFTYVEGYEGTNRSGAAVQYSSFYGWFKFAAETDYGIISSHVLDADITVKLSVQFNKTL